jgi:hypothetical protein
VLVVTGAEPFTSEASEASLRSIAEDLPLGERHISLVELDARVERRDVDHLRHTGSLKGKGRCCCVVIVRLESGEHAPAAPEVRNCHLIAR